jgi:hypothetical protein
MKLSIRTIVPAIFLLTVATASSANAAGKAAPGVLPPNSSAYGHSYAEWSAMWWQWVMSQPAVDVGGNNTHPQFDTTGAYTLAGQDDNKVIFLPAGFGADPPPQNLTRTITIPSGRPLFFPIVNAWADVLGEDPMPDIPELYRRAKEWATPAALTDLYATLDGIPLVATRQLSAYRVQSPPFAYDLPEDNFFALWKLSFPAQRVYPAVSDGYWLMLAPLPPGHYTLAFGNKLWLNVRYHITVLPANVSKQYEFQIIDPPAAYGPGAAVQIAWVNNSGLMSVQYQAPENADWYANTHAAVVERGVWKKIDVPGAAVTVPTNANSKGQIALSFTPSYPGNPQWQVVIYDRGRLLPFKVPGYQLIANAINDVGEIAAAAIDTNGNWHCFVGTAKRHRIFDYPTPNLAWSQIMGLNNHGIAVGSYAQIGLDGHGFVYDGRKFPSFDLPGAKWTNATSINNCDTIAGTFGLPAFDGGFDGVWHGYVLSRGVFGIVDLPGGNSTIPYWINDRLQIGGMCYDADWGMHGFIATPIPGRR